MPVFTLLSGLRVIGSVGSDEKLQYIINQLGFDDGFNYKQMEPATALANLAPEGIDIYYESVGGEHLEAALNAMKNFGRIVVCGLISAHFTSLNIHTAVKVRFRFSKKIHCI